MIKKEFIKLKTKELNPYPNNPRINDDAVEDVAESIRQTGNLDPIEIDENNVILSGHTRLKALQKLGYEECEVVRYTGLTEEQKKKYRLLTNKTGEKALWDFSKLEEELQDLDFDGFDFGFDLSFDKENEENEIVEDKAPEEQPEPLTKIGDLWMLGNHFLICGDSADATVIDRLMDGVKADMVFTDPPYGNGTSGKYGRGRLGVRTIAGDEDLTAFNDFVAIMDCDKIIYFLQWRTFAESMQTISDKGLKINTVAVWDKKNAGLNGAGGISEQWEAIVFAGNIKYKKFGGNVFSIAREQHKRKDSTHPHQKPIKLLAEIFDFIDKCDIILDPFGGSGSTLIACEQLNRKCYMCELSQNYCDVIIQRYINFKGSDSDVFLVEGKEKTPYKKLKNAKSIEK